MVALAVIALACGAFSIFFLISELNEAWNNINVVVQQNHGIKTLTLLWKVPLACRPVLLDIGLTLGVVWLFSMSGGIIGMAVSLMASGIISAFLYVKRRPK